jgi:hypothetical protein
MYGILKFFVATKHGQTTVASWLLFVVAMSGGDVDVVHRHANHVLIGDFEFGNQAVGKP